ncbi:MAG: hypothetical protein HUJ26_08415 [Planctomycetaceae bacterium]|nr:hypothetical protein [Planctomycetaceae bacterium]
MKSRWSVAVLVVGVIAVTVVIVSHDLQRARSEQDEPSQLLSSGSANLDSIPPPAPSYLEQEPVTGEPRHALLEDGVQPESLLDLVADRNSSPDSKVPSELPPSKNLDPVPLLSPERRKTNAAIIREVIPDVSDEDLELWLEETRELPPNEIRNMLKIRQQFGGLAETFDPDSEQSLEDEPAMLNVPEFDATLLSLNKARALVLQNMLNEKSIGYLSVELRWVSDAPQGVRLAGTTLLTDPGDNLRTQRPLDVAVKKPNLFLVVQSGDQTWLTRYGCLEIGPHRKLQLAIQGAELILSPGITVPQGVGEVSISATGEVAGVNGQQEPVTLGQLELREVAFPEYLQSVGTACYQLTDRCGKVRSGTELENQELLFTGALEQSNVNYSQQDTNLKMIDRLLKLRQDQIQSAR